MKFKILAFVFIFFSLFLVNSKTIFARDGGPAEVDPDINIRLRGWNSVSFPNQVVDYGAAEADLKAPQLSTSFTPSFPNFYQVRDRNGQGTDQSQITPFSEPGLGEIQANFGDPILAPVIGYSIGGGFNYVVLYATEHDIVIHATLDDNVRTGYTVHFINIDVNPILLDLYNKNEAGGRTQLVAIPCKFSLGSVSKGNNPLVSVRDTGSFQDIRSLDWWRTSSPGSCADIAAGYVNASNEGTQLRAYDLTNEVPCNATVDPEFHSLRPYPASPCDKKVEDTTLLCSNDLVVLKSVLPDPAHQSSCTPHADGQAYTCTYTNVPESVNVSVNLAGAKLPIMGDTEDVPNATWTSPNTNTTNFTAGQRVNNYVSWYLNGVINRAEEDFSSYDPNYLVNYSGPLNKLLPYIGQTINRIASSENAASTPSKPVDDKSARHNQVVGCDVDTLVIPCYLKDITVSLISSLVHIIAGTSTIDVRRLADFDGAKPPLESDFKNFPDYWKAFLTWEGKICSPSILGFYLCSNLQQFWPSAFLPNVPSSTTEDRVGTIGTDRSTLGGSCKTTGAPCSVICNDSKQSHFQDSCPQTFTSCNQWAIEACGTVGSIPATNPNTPFDSTGGVSTGSTNGVTFTPSGGTNYQHNLYFAHMQETAELASKLQDTFKAQSAASTSDTNTKPNIGSGCVIQDARTNPGDNLYGDVNRTTANNTQDQQIAGTVSFTASYTCTFTPPSSTSNGTVIGGYSVTCSKAMASLSMFTQTPEVQQNWDSLVGGSQSIFKRFFPQVGVNSPVTEIKETPAYTQATYLATDGNSVAAGSKTTAGDGATSVKASTYFPYIGGIKDYFLDGIQTALRPQGMGSGVLAQTSSSTSNSSQNNLACTSISNANSIDYTATSFTPKSVDNIISGLTTTNPGGFGQSTISAIKTSMNTINPITGTTRYQSIIDESTALGFNPSFVMTVWLEESAASTISNSYDFGCGAAGKNDFQGQLSCFLGLPKYWSQNKSLFSCGIDSDGSIDFLHFMLFFSEGTCTTVTKQNNQFCSHANFPNRISNFYNLVKK